LGYGRGGYKIAPPRYAEFLSCGFGAKAKILFFLMAQRVDSNRLWSMGTQKHYGMIAKAVHGYSKYILTLDLVRVYDINIYETKTMYSRTQDKFKRKDIAAASNCKNIVVVVISA
jgi:hypothetical protein